MESPATAIQRTHKFPGALGQLIARDSLLLNELGWERFVRERRGRGDIQELDELNHPARDILTRLKIDRAPAVMQTPPWSMERLQAAMARGPHKSAIGPMGDPTL